MMQYVFFGLLTGSLLAIAAAGFALIRQIEGFLNISHCQYLLIGAILGRALMDLGLNVYVAGFLACVIVGLLGTVVSWVVFAPLRTKGNLAQFFTSIGLAFVLYGLIMATWTGSGVKVYQVSFGSTVNFLGISATVGELIVIAVAWLSVLLLHIFLSHTRVGLWVRAVASDRVLARTRGVRSALVYSTVWFIATAFAALAGILIGILGAVHAELGWQYILTILAVTVMGGMTNLYGVLASGLILGLVMDLSSLVIPSKYGLLVAFSIIILVLLFRPEGLFARSRRQESGK